MNDSDRDPAGGPNVRRNGNRVGSLARLIVIVAILLITNTVFADRIDADGVGHGEAPDIETPRAESIQAVPAAISEFVVRRFHYGDR